MDVTVHAGTVHSSVNVRYELRDGNKAYFRLRDYLCPGGKYPYDDLRKDMQAAFNAGLHIYLWSLPNHLVLAGHPDLSENPDNLGCWHVIFDDSWVKTLPEVSQL